MNNSELFKRAHALAKEVHVSNSGESYAVTFGACLKLIRAENTVGAKVDSEASTSKIGEGKNLHVATNKLWVALNIAWLVIQVALLVVATWYAATGLGAWANMLVDTWSGLATGERVMGVLIPVTAGIVAGLFVVMWSEDLEDELRRIDNERG